MIRVILEPQRFKSSKVSNLHHIYTNLEMYLSMTKEEQKKVLKDNNLNCRKS